ncbi:growth arrest and DNA damage-inducible protein GADD45 alpha-like [Liolophura sinensis]|uniref:growth arrest and DNA damage-inducible protein GADD45 alpha-like n=1 Tax=Liolophura sinensis TaxID=3198878 RepID=UPI0031590EFD
MTLPDLIQAGIESQKDTKMSIGAAVKETLSQARGDGRVVHGLFECAKLLESGDENILLCLLPVETNSEDVTVHIKHTLIEAFCWENEIRLLKVDCSKKLGALLVDTSELKNDNDLAAGRTSLDFSCVLIKENEELSESEKCLTEYYNNLMCSDVFPCPIIDIPV